MQIFKPKNQVVISGFDFSVGQVLYYCLNKSHVALINFLIIARNS